MGKSSRSTGSFTHHFRMPAAGDSIATRRVATYRARRKVQMSDEEKNIRELESQFPMLSGVTFATARKQALASGQSVWQSDRGVIYEVFPDGTRRRVKEIEPPMPVVPGSKITIR
jgi:hypothetical protein